mgnify:CR=1 FL=1
MPSMDTRRCLFFIASLLSVASAAKIGKNARRLQSSVDVDLATCNVTRSDFNITIIDMSDIEIDPKFERTFNWAARRWELVIVGDLPGFSAGRVPDWFNGAFSRPFAGPVEDLVIGFALKEIDGVGGTLGRAGGTFFRTRNEGGRNVPVSTISGIMEFDLADMSRMDTTEIRSVVL